MESNEEIEDLEYQINKIDGKGIKHNILNRLHGAGHVGLAIFLYFVSEKNPLCYLYTPFVIEGISDLITGKHHSISYKLFKIHPKYKLEEIRENSYSNPNSSITS